MKLGIGAIFRDEFEYILEWIAWHRIAGFNDFIIADNNSSDGTTELLEALDEAEIINLIHQPILEKNAQLVAYQRIAQKSLKKLDAILFIDADEFITHESMIDGDEARLIKKLLTPPEVGMIGINWRTFGSSGHENQSSSPVTERFTYCCGDGDNTKNGHIKSATKIALANLIGPHKSDLPSNFKKIDPTGKELKDFIIFKNGTAEKTIYSGITARVTRSPLRINHYAIKSKEEFFRKKSKRGDAMSGPALKRGDQYFNSHDFSDDIFEFPKEKIKRLKDEIKSIEEKINKDSNINSTFTGAIDSSSKNGVSGWIASKKTTPKPPRVKIFVNGIYQDSVEPGFYRPDLKEKGISTDGANGFRWTPPAELKKGDIVEIKVNANTFKFPQRSKTEIQ